MAYCAATERGVAIKTITSISLESCRDAMRRFWDDQTDVERVNNGLALALPLMYPDGWQVQVFIEPVSATQALITDRGQTLMRLQEQGVNFQHGHTAELLAERKSVFDLQQDGFELQKGIRLPIDGLDVQLFAESLVSIAHLVYRFEPLQVVESAADDVLQQVFRDRSIAPRRNVEIDGEIERRIRVDYLVDQVQPVALQVVRRSRQLLPYMEQWGFRWADIHQRNPHLKRAMIYDPDKQQWDETTLNIGRKICDLFCPYTETQAIHHFLE